MADSAKPAAGSSTDVKPPTGPVAQGSGIAAMKALSTANSGILTTSNSATGSPKMPLEDPAQLEPKLKALVEKMLAVKGNRQQKQILLKEDEIKMVLNEVRESFMAEPMLLQVQPPVRICGDIHGQYYDLLRIFDRCGLPSTQPYLFLGDYVDRGKHSVETIVLLYAFKVLYPSKVWLLRGNHECASINKMYGFYDDVKRRYNVRLFKQFTEVFNCMPVAASISEKILCMHGGLSPELKNLQQINQIQRPCDVPERGILCDLLWADPEEDIVGYHDSDRGVSYLFGEDVVGDFLDEVDMDLIVRAHQVMDRGYAFFASRQLVTLFSAPCYCGEFDNAAAVMTIDEKLQCSFIIIPAKLV